jgi:MinD superfamily P-loop ATPase
MKEIVVISGKGGTGKTSVTASFAILGGPEIVIADCDVDASNLHLLLNPEPVERNDFYSGKTAKIDADLCSACGLCQDTCRFDAIHSNGQPFVVNAMDCEGCGYCARICPDDAIRMEENHTGKWYASIARTGGYFVHAALHAGAENSGKLVARVKNEAKRYARDNNLEYVLIDGAPGIGCPVISSLTGAQFVLIVTEPTVSGLHDLKRVYELVKKFKIEAGCIINKHDLNPEITNEILDYLADEEIPVLSTLPYDD